MRRAQRLDLVPPYLFGEIAALKQKALAEGRDLIDLGIGDPDQPTPRSIIRAIQKFVEDPETHRYDESQAGVPDFLKAVAEWYQRRFGVVLDPEREVLLLIGSKEGLAHLPWAILNPGDVSLVPDPAYTVYRVNTLLAGGEVYVMPLKAERSYLPDLSEIPSEVARKAKLLFLNYPNNPTGAVAPLSFFQQVVEFARDYDLLVCHDCAYSEVSYDGYKPVSFLQAEGAKEIGIEFHSLSKSFNMTGWRVGFAVGNAEALEALRVLKSNVDSKQFPAVTLAGAYALRHAWAEMEPTLRLYQRRRDILVEGLNSIGWKLEKPKATFYVWAPVPQGTTSLEFAKYLLESAGVLVIPGIGYGEYGEGYIRMSITVLGDRNGERIAEAVERIRKLF